MESSWCGIHVSTSESEGREGRREREREKRWDKEEREARTSEERGRERIALLIVLISEINSVYVVLGNKTHLVKLRSSWIMSAALNGLASGPPRFAAAGGLDNCCSVYRLREDVQIETAPAVELHGHEGYISCCKFADPGYRQVRREERVKESSVCGGRRRRMEMIEGEQCSWVMDRMLKWAF